jgi:hypothetical protein
VAEQLLASYSVSTPLLALQLIVPVVVGHTPKTSFNMTICAAQLWSVRTASSLGDVVVHMNAALNCVVVGVVVRVVVVVGELV